MTISLVTWNVAGVDFLKVDPKDRQSKRNQYQACLQKIIDDANPDVVVFQEVVRYEQEFDVPGLSTPKKGDKIELFDAPTGYNYVSSIAIDTVHQNDPFKWGKIRKNLKTGKCIWSENTYLGQGYGILWRSELPHSNIRETEIDNARPDTPLEIENVRIETGVFMGDRDTEPRILMVAHFVHENRDVFIVNVHLTTLKGEREGFPEEDENGCEIRSYQIDIISSGIVSRINKYRKNLLGDQARRGIWFLAGDFNRVPSSTEIAKLDKMNFARLCNNDATKREKRGYDPSIKVDFIFVGPRYYSFDPYRLPMIIDTGLPTDAASSYFICKDINISDHFPIGMRFNL